jgi:uncharacterized membrane protein
VGGGERRTSSGAEARRDREAETGRLAAFSDGVFSIAITLLVLEIKVPHPGELPRGGLAAALLAAWPSFLAYLTSFGTILVMWINHHALFTHIRRASLPLLYLNGLLLLFVTFVPFPTAVLAEYVERPEARTAAAVYAGTFFAIAIAFNLLWRHAARGRRLLDPEADPAEAEAITRQYAVGPWMYGVATLLAFVYVPASVGLCLALALYFAFTGSLRGRVRRA